MYQFKHTPKSVISGSFDFGDDLVATIIDDPDILKKCASSKVVAEWGDLKPKKNHSIIHLAALGTEESVGPNRNGDAFQNEFLKHAHPTFLKYGALYREHQTDGEFRKEGTIERSAHHEEMGRTELAVSADHDKCGDWLAKIEKGKRVDFSMGFDCELDICKICGNEAPTRKQYCEHVRKGAKKPYGMNRILPDGRKCYVINPKGVFNDISQVGVGADMTAQHLRKVAGLIDDDEVIGGAELMERLFPNSLNKTAAEKARVIEKLSRMEKTVPVTSFKLGDEQMIFGNKTAKALRHIPENGMFAEMAKLGTLLPMRQFYQTIMGQMFDTVEPYVNEAEKVAHLAVSFIDEDPTLKLQACKNSIYDTQKSASLSIASDDIEALQSHFSVSQDSFFTNLQETTRIGSRRVKIASMTEVSNEAKALLAEYGTYKVAFMLALGEDSSEATWRAVAMTY